MQCLFHRSLSEMETLDGYTICRFKNREHKRTFSFDRRVMHAPPLYDYLIRAFIVKEYITTTNPYITTHITDSLRGL
jgi:hypothetical protein